MVITGATGYIGSRLMQMARERGLQPVAASRVRPAAGHVPWMAFDLVDEEPIELPPGTSAVVHLASLLSWPLREDEEKEVRAARRLASAARKIGARFVFVSSQTAQPDAPTRYGVVKWRIEQEIGSELSCVVRPGQVYGGPRQALFGDLVRTVERARILPAFVPAPVIQPIHVDDLCAGVLNVLGMTPMPALVRLGAPSPMRFSRFLSLIGTERLRRMPWFIPVPVALVRMASAAMGTRLSRQTGIERLASLFNLPVMQTQSDLQMLGLSLRDVREGLHPSGNGRRRALLLEAEALLTYVLKERPRPAASRRYVRAMEKLRDGVPLEMPTALRGKAIAVCLLDRGRVLATDVQSEFHWRLDAATSLAEASPEGARRFLAPGSQRRPLRSAAGLGAAAVKEVAVRLARLLCGPLVKRFMQARMSA